MPDSRTFTCSISQFALACNLTTVFYLLTLSDGLPGTVYPRIMLLYAPLLYWINRLFLRRERTMLSLTVLNGLLVCLTLTAHLLLDPWRGFASLVFTAAFLLWLSVRGCRFALSGAPLRGTLLTLDCSFLLLPIFIGYSAILGWESRWSIPALCGLAASITAAASSRSPKSRNAKGWLAVGAAFALLVGILWLFVSVIAAPAGSGLISVWTLITSGVHALKRLLLGVLTYLLSLLPNAEPGELPPYELPDFSHLEGSAAEESSPVAGAIMLALLIGCAAALLVWLVRRMGKFRLGRMQKKSADAMIHRERTSFLKGLLHLLTSMAEGARFRLLLWKGRNTPVGLYFLLVHRCRRAPWHKRPCETPREFLLRMAGTARSDEELSSALKQLARETDAALYSGHAKPTALAYAPMIRRKIGTAARKQFLSDLLPRSRSKSKKQKKP